MNFRYQKINSQLTEYVRTILAFENSEPSKLPLFTNGMAALIYKTNNHITLFGQSVPDEEWKESTIAFFFKPFMLAPIFKLSAQELKAKPVELSRWNAQKEIALKIQLYHAKSIQEKVEILSHFIFTQTECNKRDCEIIRYATDSIMQNSGADVLSQLPDNLNLTERTFQRTFKKYVGITANDYRRICQHYFAFSHLESGHYEKLTDIVYTNGYYDQSHYIRSFKEFTNTTPNEYLQSGLNKKI